MTPLEKKLRKELDQVYFSEHEIEELVKIYNVVKEDMWAVYETFEIETLETGIIPESNIIPVLSYALSQSWEELNTFTLKRMIMLKTLELSHENRVLKEYKRYQHEIKQVKLEAEAEIPSAVISVKRKHREKENDLEDLKTLYNKELKDFIANPRYETWEDFWSEAVHG